MTGDIAGWRDPVRAPIAPELCDLVDELSNAASTTAWSFPGHSTFFAGAVVGCRIAALRINDDGGHHAGTALICMPEVGMAMLGSTALGGDLRHFERMQQIVRPDRRPAAILFADPEGSPAMARRVSTASYFALDRRLVRSADQCVINADGLVGRHVGDGMVAFFLALHGAAIPLQRVVGSASPAVRRPEPRDHREAAHVRREELGTYDCRCGGDQVVDGVDSTVRPSVLCGH